MEFKALSLEILFESSDGKFEESLDETDTADFNLPVALEFRQFSPCNNQVHDRRSYVDF